MTKSGSRRFSAVGTVMKSSNFNWTDIGVKLYTRIQFLVASAEIGEMVDTQDLPTLQEMGIHLCLRPPTNPSTSRASKLFLEHVFQIHPFLSISTVTGVSQFLTCTFPSRLPRLILWNAKITFRTGKSDCLKPFIGFLLRRENWISFVSGVQCHFQQCVLSPSVRILHALAELTCL